MAEVVKVGFELDLFRGSVGNVGDVEGQDGRSMRCGHPDGGGAGVAAGALSDKVAAGRIPVEGLRGACFRCRLIDERGPGGGEN